MATAAKLVARIPAGVKQVTFGEHPAADVRAEALNLEFRRTSFRLVWPGGPLPWKAR